MVYTFILFAKSVAGRAEYQVLTARLRMAEEDKDHVETSIKN